MCRLFYSRGGSALPITHRQKMFAFTVVPAVRHDAHVLATIGDTHLAPRYVSYDTSTIFIRLCMPSRLVVSKVSVSSLRVTRTSSAAPACSDERWKGGCNGIIYYSPTHIPEMMRLSRFPERKYLICYLLDCREEGVADLWSYRARTQAHTSTQALA